MGEAVENLLSLFGSGGIWLNWLPGFGRISDLPTETFSVSAIFSGAGAVILGKFTGHLGMIAMPLNYVGLLIGALLANWAFSGVSLPLAGDLQSPIVYAISGMCVTGLAMMAILRRL
jgi:hypothetical protein